MASTATSAPLQEMFVLEHPKMIVQQNTTKKEKKKKEGKKKRVSRVKGHSVGKVKVGLK